MPNRIDPNVALVREELQGVRGVFDTWIEWELSDDSPQKTLVVQVTFDTDPHAPSFDSSMLADIEYKIKDVLKNRTPLIFSRVKVVPPRR